LDGLSIAFVRDALLTGDGFGEGDAPGLGVVDLADKTIFNLNRGDQRGFDHKRKEKEYPYLE
jgi:hypothetical protein